MKCVYCLCEDATFRCGMHCQKGLYCSSQCAEEHWVEEHHNDCETSRYVNLQRLSFIAHKIGEDIKNGIIIGPKNTKLNLPSYKINVNYGGIASGDPESENFKSSILIDVAENVDTKEKVFLKLINISYKEGKENFVREVFAHKILKSKNEEQIKLNRFICQDLTRCAINTYVATIPTKIKGQTIEFGLIALQRTTDKTRNLSDFITNILASLKSKFQLSDFYGIINQLAKELVKNLNDIHVAGLAHRAIDTRNIFIDLILFEKNRSGEEEKLVFTDFSNFYIENNQRNLQIYSAQDAQLTGTDLFVPEGLNLPSFVTDNKIRSIDGTIFIDPKLANKQKTEFTSKTLEENQQLDIYSLGVVLYFLETLKNADTIVQNPKDRVSWKPDINKKTVPLFGDLIANMTGPLKNRKKLGGDKGYGSDLNELIKKYTPKKGGRQ